MKRYIAAAIAVALLLCLFTGCAPAQTDGSGMVTHTIGVATYNIKDAQVMMFKDYLDGYIKECFPDAEFLYSDSIGAADLDGDGKKEILCLNDDQVVFGQKPIRKVNLT